MLQIVIEQRQILPILRIIGRPWKLEVWYAVAMYYYTLRVLWDTETFIDHEVASEPL